MSSVGEDDKDVNWYSPNGKSMEFSQKIKNRTGIKLISFTCGYLSKENKSTISKRY